MEFLVELILQFLGELLLEFFVQFLAELGARIFAEKLSPELDMKMWASALGYIVLGGLCGAGSLQFWPHTYLHGAGLRVAGLIVVPLLAGLVSAGMGAWRKRRGQRLIRLDHFGYGCLFAFSMSLVRFIWAA